MKAIFCTQYGPPEVLQLREIATPVPKTNEVLVKVKASAVTSGDARVRGLRVPAGFSLIMRLGFGWNGPKTPLLGRIFSGEVVSTGNAVTRFKIGDAVFGSNPSGTYAEYISVSEEAVMVKKPEHLSFEEAAALPFGALTSLFYLRDLGKIKKDQEVLIRGASGSLGVYGIQLARHFGAQVTAVCSGNNAELVRSLGAHRVIDYTQTDFTQTEEVYDVIYDTVGGLSFDQAKKALKPGGRCLFAVAGIPDYLRVLWHGFISSLPGGQGNKKLIAGVASFKLQDLNFIKQLTQQHLIRPVVDRSFSLEEIVEAHRYVDSGHKKGAVIILTETK